MDTSQYSAQYHPPAIVSPILVTGTYDGTIISWDICDKTWKAVQEVTVNKASVNRLSISEDGTVIAAATSSGIQFYRFPKLELIMTFEEKSNVTSVFFGRLTPNNFFYSTENGELCTANYSIPRSQTVLYDNKKVDINCAEMSPNQGEIYFGDSAGFVKLINAREPSEEPRNNILCNKNAAIKALAIDPVCTMIFAGDAQGDVWWGLVGESVGLVGTAGDPTENQGTFGLDFGDEVQSGHQVPGDGER